MLDWNDEEARDLDRRRQIVAGHYRKLMELLVGAVMDDESGEVLVPDGFPSEECDECGATLKCDNVCCPKCSR